ncbi:MAG: alpha-glucosidase [Oscillospiraceae bacterium]|nr:alpha-glucosidase [Oscillospiraceae bacterium]
MDLCNWWKEAVVYQIYPRSFQDSNGDGIGDIQGIISRLDYLKDLGIDIIWLSPVYQSPNIDGGYDISDYQAVSSDFGTMEDMERLLQQAHLRGLRVVMDLVVNHTSDQHAWFLESRSSKDNPKRDWYIWRDGFQDGEEPNGLRSVFSGSAWEKDEQTGQYYMHLFAREQPDLNWENAEVREAVYRMMRWWLDKGVDGFRMDVINMISKPPEALAASGGAGCECVNGPYVHTYLQEMNREVLKRYDIMTVGETPGVTVEQARQYGASDSSELSMIFQFELMDIDSGALGKWNLRRYALPELKRILSRWQTGLEGFAWNSLFWSNHDQPRAVSRFGDDSNDENRVLSAKMLATCLHMMQGTPYIYQGEELGMTNMPFSGLEDIRDIETVNAYNELVRQKHIYTHDEMMARIRKSGRDNARTPMQWNGAQNGGFTNGTPWIAVNPNTKTINAASQAGDPDSVFSYYKKLIRLRKQYPVIVYGSYTEPDPGDERVFAYTRRWGGSALYVRCNFTAETIDNIEVPRNAELLIGNYPEPVETMRPYEARVYYGESDEG